MTDKEYQQKKAKCWDEYKRTNLDGEVQWQPVSRYDVFCAAFDRAYALGKKKETITQEEIKKAAEKYSQSLGKSRDVTWNDGEYGFIAGANFALGKKIGISEFYDTEDTVIQGWVAIDEAYAQCFLHTEKPIQKAQPIADTGDYDTVWDSNGKTYLLDAGLFPDLAWDDDPQEVEIILKRKKK